MDDLTRAWELVYQACVIETYLPIRGALPAHLDGHRVSDAHYYAAWALIDAKAATLLETHWAAVDAVAQALLREHRPSRKKVAEPVADSER
jgi:hypothetical protein